MSENNGHIRVLTNNVCQCIVQFNTVHTCLIGSNDIKRIKGIG